MEEMKILRDQLDALDIPWRDMSDELITRTHFDHNGKTWSAVFGPGFSHGNEQGLLELADLDDMSGTIGNITAAGIIAYVFDGDH